MTDIVIGMDTSAGAAAALRWAVGEAEARGWTVTAVLAWGLLDQYHALPDESFDPQYTDAEARDALDAAIDAAVGSEAAPKVERRVTPDLPARALIAAADGARLLVVGARGLGGFKRLLLGSVSEQCLHHAPCPVAIVHTDRPEHAERPADRPDRDRVVVGVDGSDDGRRALDWALDEARARRGAVEVVHAWRPPLLAGYPLDPLASGTDELEDAARTVMERSLEDVDVTGLVGPVERTLRIARPASALLEAAEHADLVVVGSRGVGGFRGLLVGSVSLQVARHSPCPVVVVRAGPQPG